MARREWPEKVLFGSMAFAIFWLLAVFPALPILPVGRTAGSLIGAVLTVVLGVISPEEAYSAIDLPIVSLLFATMIVGGYLEEAGLFKCLGKLLSWKCAGPKDLLCRVSAIAAVSSAFFTNDTTCVLLTQVVLQQAAQKRLPSHPLLLALASSANIGSSATPIGNPQNLVIAIRSGLSFGEFLKGLIAPAIAGVAVNSVILLSIHGRSLSSQSLHTVEENAANHDVGLEEGSVEMASVRVIDHHRSWKVAGKITRKVCVLLVTIGMLVALLRGLNMSWTALTAATVLMILDFKDARCSLDKVSYSLLVFFCGMFITVEGFNRTGIPGRLWSMTEGHAQIVHAKGLAVLALVIIVLCNIASNVPTVMLLGERVAASAGAEGKRAWLVLAWVSTVAGNLSLLGSAANLIVCEQARRSSDFPHTLSFWRHLGFGIPSTIIVTAVGLPLLSG